MEINLKKVVWALEEFSSEDEQKRLWAGIGNDGSETSSLDEALCQLFDDSCFNHLLDRGAVLDQLTPSQVNSLLKLGRLCNSVPRNLNPVVMIQCPAMVEIRDIAHSLLEDLSGDEVLTQT